MLAPRKLRLLVSLPCLNEEESVAKVIGSLPRDLPGIGEIVVLVIDDGSKDQTRARAIEAGAHVISHGQNRGVGAAFQTMLKYAVAERFDVMANIDADGQFDPKEIADLVAPVVNGEADFVTGSRFVDRALIPHNMGFVKRWGNERMSNLISALTGKKFHDVSCGFRAYGREALLHLNLHGRFTYTQETFLDLTSKGLRVKEVPVHVRYFEGRKSRVASNIPKYAMRTASIILRLYRDYNPLRFFFFLAGVHITAGLAFLAILFGHYFTTGQFTGQIWSGFVGGGLAFVGLMFGILGIVADMLDRIRVNQERILYQLKRGTPASALLLPPPSDAPSDES